MLNFLDNLIELSRAAENSSRKIKDVGEAILGHGFMLHDKISKNVGLAKSLAAKSEEGKKVGTLGLLFEAGKHLLR